MKRIYLDHAATSPLRPDAKAAMEEGFALWANPSSPHAEGRKAKAALEDARERCKAALGWDGELIFTSGASESAALAIRNANAGARLVSSVEHDCILRAAPDAERLPVKRDGALDLEYLTEAVQREAPLVVTQSVNSETGNHMDLCEIADIVRDVDGLLLVDATQSIGKYKLGWPADMAILSAHKFGGPVGIGALLVHDLGNLEPSGGHERGYRRGTENLPAALGMATALEAGGEPYLQDGVFETVQKMAQSVRSAGGMWLGDTLDAPTAHIHSIVHPTLSATAQVLRLDMMGFSVSQGSACSSGTMKSSAVLRAMGINDDTASRTIRVSLGWSTTPEELGAFVEAWENLH